MDGPRPAERAPWLLALATTNLLFLVAAAWIVGNRMTELEKREDRRVEARPAAPAARPAGVEPVGPVTLDTLNKRLQKIEEDGYQYYSDLYADIHEMKRKVGQLGAALRNLAEQNARPGTPTGTYGLAAPDHAPTPEALARYAKDAAAAGIRVSPGRVEVPGFLNMAPNTAMAIEYFVTRYPEAGHETLVHVLGNATLADARNEPQKMSGMVTAIYKGLVVAGFMQGQPSGYKGDPADPTKRPQWVPPKGDSVYVGVRYVLHGKTHVARATDWVVDPSIRGVLPIDAFRFTGSTRIEEWTTGDEQLSSEVSGLVVSVYRNPTTLIEISVPSNEDDAYTYNHQRIPRPAVLLLDGGGRIDTLRDILKGELVLLGHLDGDATKPIEKAPMLLVRTEEDAPKAIPFARAASPAGAWVLTDPALKRSGWSVRLDVGGKSVESVGFDPLLLELIFSKTPIVPEGDGAKPIEPVQIAEEDLPPPGMGERPDKDAPAKVEPGPAKVEPGNGEPGEKGDK
jgi:hypothetical protein